MKKEKLTYLSPLTETFVIRFEGVICSSNDPIVNLGDVTKKGYEDEYDLDLD